MSLPLGPDDLTPTVAPRIDAQARRPGDRPLMSPEAIAAGIAQRSDRIAVDQAELLAAIEHRRRRNESPRRPSVWARIKRAWARLKRTWGIYDYRNGFVHGALLLAAWVLLCIAAAVGIKHG